MSRTAKQPEVWSAPPDEVRRRFLDFFRVRGHEVLPSASLVPENDPSLLFIGAGMAPFKDRFLGRVPPTFRRAATSQKCLRTGDLENVGRTPGHHTFFEMLGNFSFGDYFKKEAIEWAWEFLTVEMAIPKERLRVTVYRDDDEAAGLWTKVAGIPSDRIGRLGAKSNFWPANAPEDGPDGLCGPCSEIFFDLGFKPDPSVACSVKDCPESPESPDCECRRFLEVWNLVFQQFDRKGRDNLVPLASKNIDTGMGFERLLTVLAHLREPEKNIYSNFDTALFREMVDHGLEGRDAGSGFVVKARRVADHARAAVFCVADGVRPSNEGRGYVLRRVIRRAIRDLYQMGWHYRPYLLTYPELITKVMGYAYPDLVSGERGITEIIRVEENQFLSTYSTGHQLLMREVGELKAAARASFPGDILFQLYDTFGFPPDLAVDLIREEGFAPDLAGFEVLMEQARQRSREGSKMATDIFASGPLDRLKKAGTVVTPGTLEPKITTYPPTVSVGPAATVFLGYGEVPEGPDSSYRWEPGLEGRSPVVEILKGNQPADELRESEEGAVLLRATPFYAEQGGQVGDTGTIETAGGLFRVRDTQKVETFHLHLGSVERGALRLGEEGHALVDGARRDAVRRNHTGTHLLHRVLKQVLGEEARQAGSLVAPDSLRFDFTWPRALTPEERERVEVEVNRRIRENHAVMTRVYTLDEARATGAVSMFGEKYGSRVRVLTAGDSREFCGGTHCRATGDIEEFRIVSEKSIGSGVRRIEAVTGAGAAAALEQERRLAGAREEEERRRREAARTARKAATRGSSESPDPLAAERRTAGRLAFVALEGGGEEALLAAADRVKADGGAALAALLLARSEEGVSLVAAGNPAAVKAGFKAGAAVAAAAKALGGGGGGRPDLARGKGKDPARIPEAVAAFEEYLRTL